MTTHGHCINGMSKTYGVWSTMKSRCNNPNTHQYRWYGEKGIKVCDRWENSFMNFLEDMGEQPEGLTIDRKENDGNYEPSNCRWVTWDIQRANMTQPGANPHLLKAKAKAKTDKLRTRYNRSVINLHTGQVYNNQVDLAKSLNVSKQAVSFYFKGLCNKLRGHKYMFYKAYLVNRWRGFNILFKWRTI